MVTSAPTTAERGLDNQWVERLGRVGLVARGAVYAVLGIIVALMALGSQHAQPNQQGALRTIASQPFGQVLLWIIAVGLLGYALWQFAALAGPEAHRESSGKTWLKRVEFVVKGVLYLVLAWTAAQIAMHAGTSSGAGFTASVMKSSVWGQVLVGLVGVVIAVVGVALVLQGWRYDFEKKLRTWEMSPTTRRVVETLGRVGYIARGIVFAIFGVFVVVAAVNFDPKKAQGIDVALRAVANAPLGKLLLLLIALGLLAFGAYSVTEARYRQFRT